jgi:hypothetical protein
MTETYAQLTEMDTLPLVDLDISCLICLRTSARKVCTQTRSR